MKTILSTCCFCLCLITGLRGQYINSDQLLGVWKMEHSGFIEEGKEIIKDFNACRLSQNFVFHSNFTVDYTYYEGDLDTCYKAAPETYKWELKGDSLMLETGGYYGFYLAQLKDNGELRLEAIREKREPTGDAELDKMLNTIHFDVYRRHHGPVECNECKLILKLD